MLALVYSLIAAAVAGVLGFAAHSAPEAAEYLPRLRVLLLGAVLLGYLGVALFIWREKKGLSRWMLLVLGLLAARLCYFLVVNLGVLAAGWLELGARGAGMEGTSALLHYSLGVFVSLFSSLVALLTLGAAGNAFRKIRWAAVGILLLAVGIFSLWHGDDRRILPQRLRHGEAPAPTSRGPGYGRVAEDEKAPARDRIAAAGAAVRHAISPRSGWGGKIREEMLARYRGYPEASLTERTSALEGAMLRARVELRTSPRTPRES